MKVRVLVVDDEPWARKRTVALLGGESEVEVVGECGDGAEAIVRIGELAPDLVFLDVQIPEVDGFEVLEAVGPERRSACRASSSRPRTTRMRCAPSTHRPSITC